VFCVDTSEVVSVVSDTTRPGIVVLDILFSETLVTMIRCYRFISPIESLAIAVSTPLFVWLGCKVPVVPDRVFGVGPIVLFTVHFT